MAELTVAEAAEQSGYSEGHIRRLIRWGKIKARQIGARVYLIDAESLLKYTEAMNALGNEKHSPG
jgi:excisionase family DNA binding protein